MDLTPQFQQFHPFPNLPSELRLKIWTLALHTPRIVYLSCRKTPFHHRSPEIPRTIESYSSCSGTNSTPVPALLHANRESRHEALAFYTVSFQAPNSLIYVSFPYDTLWLSDHILVNIPEHPRQRIQRMVLDVRDPEYFEYFNMDYLRGMTALEKLQLMASRDPAYYNWGSRDMYAERLVVDFETTRRAYPEWNCPEVVIMDKKTLEPRGFVESGAGVYPPGSDED
jgi:hypothetical protein